MVEGEPAVALIFKRPVGDPYSPTRRFMRYSYPGKVFFGDPQAVGKYRDWRAAEHDPDPISGCGESKGRARIVTPSSANLLHLTIRAQATVAPHRDSVAHANRSR